MMRIHTANSWRRSGIALAVMALVGMSSVSVSPVAAQQTVASQTLIARTHYQLGQQYLRAGEKARAREEFRRAADADRSFLEAQIQAANLASEDGDHAAAMHYYRRALTLNPDNAQIVKSLASSAMATGDISEAKRQYRALLAFPDEEVDALLGLARLALQEESWPEVRQLLDHLGLANNPEALSMRGHAAHQLGRLDEAADLYRRALDVSPGNGEVWLNLGILEAARGNDAAAITALERAVTLISDPSLAYRYLGAVQFQRGGYAAAVKSFRRVVGASPQDLQARFNLARALTEISRWDEALIELDQVRNAGGSLEDLAPLYADVYFGLGRYRDAREFLERANRLNPDDTGILKKLAQSYQRLDQKARALQIYERILLTHPNDLDVLSSLADIYAGTGESEKALKMSRRVREIALQRDLDEALQAERTIWRERIEDVQNQARLEVRTAQAQAEERVLQLEENMRRQLAELRAATDERVSEIQRDARQIISEVRADADSRTVAAERRAAARIEEFRAEFVPPDADAELARVQAEAAAEIEKAREEAAEYVRSETIRIRRDAQDRVAAEAGGVDPRLLAENRQALASAQEQLRQAQARIAQLEGLPAPAAPQITPPLSPMDQRGLEALRTELERERAIKEEQLVALEGAESVRAELARARAELERERAIKEEAQATAERVEAEAEQIRENAESTIAALNREIMIGLRELGADTAGLSNRPLERLEHYVQLVRLRSDARVSQAKLDAEERVNSIRQATEGEIENILKDAKIQVDRARTQSAEEIRRAQLAADSEVLRRVTNERERLASEALAKRLALTENIRAEIEADAQIRFLGEKAEAEASFEADRIRMAREYEKQLSTLQSEYQKRLEAARMEAQQAVKQLEAVTSSDTALLSRSQLYQEVVRENAMMREDLASARRRLEDVGGDRRQLVAEADRLRTELASLQSRIGALEQEVRRYRGVGVLSESLQQGININSAGLETLQALPGIGIQEAQNIVWYRDNVGQFREVDELSKVPGIDAEKARSIRGLIRVR